MSCTYLPAAGVRQRIETHPPSYLRLQAVPAAPQRPSQRCCSHLDRVAGQAHTVVAQIVAPTNAASQNVVQNANSFFDLQTFLKESPERLLIALSLTAAAAVGYWLSQKKSET